MSDDDWQTTILRDVRPYLEVLQDLTDMDLPEGYEAVIEHGALIVRQRAVPAGVVRLPAQPWVTREGALDWARDYLATKYGYPVVTGVGIAQSGPPESGAPWFIRVSFHGITTGDTVIDMHTPDDLALIEAEYHRVMEANKAEMLAERERAAAYYEKAQRQQRARAEFEARGGIHKNTKAFHDWQHEQDRKARARIISLKGWATRRARQQAVKAGEQHDHERI